MDYVEFYGTEQIQRPSNDRRLDYTVFESFILFFLHFYVGTASYTLSQCQCRATTTVFSYSRPFAILLLLLLFF